MSQKPKSVKVADLKREVRELTPEQAEAAQGGRKTRGPKFFRNCVSGVHYKTVTIEMR